MKVTDNRIGSGSGDSLVISHKEFKRPKNDGVIGGGSSNLWPDGSGKEGWEGY